MIYLSNSLNRLLGELKKMPGIGDKTALRLAFHLLKSPAQVTALAESLLEVHGRVRFCSICHGITEDNPCCICSGDRDDSIICIVEEPQDLLAIERSRAFKGRYHVLQGALSPLTGVNPGDLTIAALLQRVAEKAPREVIIATSFTVEGEATALYLTRQLKPLGIRITRLAHGIPLGSDLEYVDMTTMQHAVEGRSEL